MPGPRSVRSLQSQHQHQHHHHFNHPHHHPNGPPSPSLSATTRASLDFPSRPAVLITRADLRNSLNAYETLLSSAKAYTSAMLSMAKASSDLACALETCARVKGAHESGPGLQAASGLHFLKSNYEQVLCDTFWKDFSIPLLSHYDTYRSGCSDRQVLHDKAISEKSKELKEAEARNAKAGRKKERDLNSFRRALAELQSHVDAIDELKAQYYNEVLEAEEEVWGFIESKVALIVRSQLEISERISSKGTSDPVLEQMLATIPDPFGSYGPPKQDGEIFSILPPISLLSSGANSLHNTSAELNPPGTNDTSVSECAVDANNAPKGTTATSRGEEAGRDGAKAGHATETTNSKYILPANIMSSTSSTPSKGLSRNLQPSASSSTHATPTRNSNKTTSALMDDDVPSSSTPRASRKTEASSVSATSRGAASNSDRAKLSHHVPRDSLLGLSAVSEATTSVTTSSTEGATGGANGSGLFGSESVDFEELLEREQRRRRAEMVASSHHPDPDWETTAMPTETSNIVNRVSQGDRDEEEAEAARRRSSSESGSTLENEVPRRRSAHSRGSTTNSSSLSASSNSSTSHNNDPKTVEADPSPSNTPMTAASRLRQVLSIIEEDSQNASRKDSRPVSTVDPDPDQDPFKASNTDSGNADQVAELTTNGNEQVANSHPRGTSSIST